jgi:serine/threonine-protein kinase RsbW
MASKIPTSGSLEIDSTASAVEDICQQLISLLEDAHFSKDDVFAVHLALEEALINAVEHGNKMDPEKKVKIDYQINSDKVDISITDQGPGFNPEHVPDPRIGENIYKYDGRGLLLIQSFMDEVKFNKSGNCLNMIRFKDRTGSVADKDSKIQGNKTTNL